MPRSLRWYILLCNYKLYIYIGAGMIALLSAFCLGLAIYSYKAYGEQVMTYEQVQADEKSVAIHQQYDDVQEKISQTTSGKRVRNLFIPFGRTYKTACLQI